MLFSLGTLEEKAFLPNSLQTQQTQIISIILNMKFLMDSRHNELSTLHLRAEDMTLQKREKDKETV